MLALAGCQSSQSTTEQPNKAAAPKVEPAGEAERDPVVVTSVRLQIRNPSISPDHRVDVDYELSRSAVDDFDARMTALLSETMVNDQVTLAEYIRLLAAGDQAALATIRAHDPPPPEPLDGASITTLSLVTETHGVFEFDDGRGYSGTRVSELRELVVAKGTKTETGPSDRRPIVK